MEPDFEELWISVSIYIREWLEARNQAVLNTNAETWTRLANAEANLADFTRKTKDINSIF